MCLAYVGASAIEESGIESSRKATSEPSQAFDQALHRSPPYTVFLSCISSS